MSDTHVNAFKADVKDKIEEVKKVVAETEEAFAKLVEKLEADVAPEPVAEEAPAKPEEVKPQPVAPVQVNPLVVPEEEVTPTQQPPVSPQK